MMILDIPKKVLKFLFRPFVRAYMRRMKELFLPEAEQIRAISQQIAELQPLPAQVAELQKLPAQVAELQKLPAQVAELQPLPAQVAELQSLHAQVEELKSRIGELNTTLTGFTNARIDFERGYSELPTYWKRAWQTFLNEHRKELPELVSRLKAGMSAESQSYVDYFVWLYTDVISPQEKFQNVKYRNEFVWHPRDLQLMREIAEEDKSVPPEFNCISDIFFSPHDFHDLYGLKSFDVPVSDRLKGKDVIDGGAWIGDSSIAFVTAGARKVYAFEPNPQNIEKVRMVSGVHPQIVPVELGLSDRSGEATLKIYGDMDMGSGYFGQDVSDSFEWKKYREVVSHTVSIDDYVEENGIEPALIKLDVEGNEYAAIRGAGETLRKFRPLVICAMYHNPVDFFNVKPYLESLNVGYRFCLKRLNILVPNTDLYLLAWPE